MPNTGPPQPYKTPFLEQTPGLISKAWSIWFQNVAASAYNVIRTIMGLTNNAIVLADGTSQLKAGPLGTLTTVLHGNASGSPSYAAVSLTADVTGVLPVANGGANLTKSANLTDKAIVLATAANTVGPGPLGTGTTVLHGNAAGNPTYGAVALASDVSGVLPVANGGTNAATAAAARASLSAAQIQAPGGPHTVVLLKLTGGGTNGSLSFNSEGVITGYLDPT